MALRGAERQARYREQNRARLNAKRRAARKAKASARVSAAVPPLPADPVGELARWSRDVLKVPAGHGLAGQPMVLPAFSVRWLRDALAPGIREAGLFMGRKNAKSAIVAVYLLGRLAGPIRQAGYRAGVASVDKAKAGELRAQMEGIATASGLTGLRFLRSPAPGRVVSATGSVDILSADKSSGHASGFDDAIVDELGLLAERDRALISGLRTSTSAKNGRFLAISILGDSPFPVEMIGRQANPATVVHTYQAPADCALDDPAAWAAANPGLACGIKSASYMADEARRVLLTPSDQAHFRAFDLNQPQSPSREMICSVSDWQGCIVPADELPPRDGRCVVGFELGGSSSMTALCALWPGTGRLEVWAAFPDTPGLKTRGEVDNAPYEQMRERGELALYAGRVTPVGEFLKDCAARLAGERIIAAGADRFRKAEARQALESAALRWPMVWRGVGAHARADGSHDVRAFQRRVLGGGFRMAESLLMVSAIKESIIRRDPAGNPALDKHRQRGRIDALQAAVISAGLAELHAKPRRTVPRLYVAG